MNEQELIYTTEMAKATGEIVKDSTEAMIMPTAKSIGSNVGLLIDGVFGWLGCWGETQKIKQKKYIEGFKQSLNDKIEGIDQNQLKEPEMNIIGPAVEASKFFYEEEYYRNMFSNLIAASCDKSKTSIIHPSYVEVIKQLSSLDAKFLSMFKYHNTYPMVSVTEVFPNGNLQQYEQYIFDFKDKNDSFDISEIFSLTPSLINLNRLALLKNNHSVIELGYDYNKFKNNFMYIAFGELKEDKNNELRMEKYRIELTQYGKKFLSVCL